MIRFVDINICYVNAQFSSGTAVYLWINKLQNFKLQRAMAILHSSRPNTGH